MEVQWLLFQCPVHEPAAVLALVTGILENESDRLALEDVCLDSMYLWQAADRQVDPNHLHQGNYRQLGREHLHIAVGRAKARLWHTISIVAVPPATHLLPTFGLVLLHPAGPRAELRQWLRIYSPNWHLLGAAGILAEGQPLEDASQHKKILQYITAFFHRPRSERRLPTTPGWHPGSVPAARWLPDAALKQLSTQTWPASYPELLHDLHVWHYGGGTWAPVWATVPTSPLQDWFLKEAVQMVYEQNNLANRPSFSVLPMPMTQEADSPRYSLHCAASSTTAAVMISGIVLAEKDVQALLDSNMRKAVRANFGQEAEACEDVWARIDGCILFAEWHYEFANTSRQSRELHVIRVFDQRSRFLRFKIPVLFPGRLLRASIQLGDWVGHVRDYFLALPQAIASPHTLPFSTTEGLKQFLSQRCRLFVASPGVAKTTVVLTQPDGCSPGHDLLRASPPSPRESEAQCIRTKPHDGCFSGSTHESTCEQGHGFDRGTSPLCYHCTLSAPKSSPRSCPSPDGS